MSDASARGAPSDPTRPLPPRPSPQVGLVGASLFFTAVAIAAYYRGRGPARKWGGGLAVTAALLLHTTVGAYEKAWSIECDSASISFLSTFVTCQPSPPSAS